MGCSDANEEGNLQPHINKQQGENMPISASRIPPPKVTPIVIGNIRIEQIKNGLNAGFEQMGGYLAAYNVDNDELLWSLKVYDNLRSNDMEGDVQDVFFRTMTLQPNGNLIIENEKRVKYEVNIETKDVKLIE